MFWISLWVLVQAFVICYYGPKVNYDTYRYVEEAAAWRSDVFEGSYHFWYSGYILFLACFAEPLAQVNWIVAIQMIVSLVAFYALLRLVGTGNITRRCLIGIYLLYIPYHQWNACLLTESLFCSFILFTFYTRGYGPRTRYPVCFVFCLVIVTLLRPNGFLLPLSYAACELWRNSKQYEFIKPLALFLGALIFLIVNSNTETFYLFIRNSMAAGEYICGYPSEYQISLGRILLVESSYNGTLVRLYYIFMVQPWECLRLVFLKVVFLLAEVRPFYNKIHNIGIIVEISALYLLFFKNISHLSFPKAYILGFVILNIVMVGLTYVDWDGRFFAALFPAIIILSVPPREPSTAR